MIVKILLNLMLFPSSIDVIAGKSHKLGLIWIPNAQTYGRYSKVELLDNHKMFTVYCIVV